MYVPQYTSNFNDTQHNAVVSLFTNFLFLKLLANLFRPRVHISNVVEGRNVV